MLNQFNGYNEEGPAVLVKYSSSSSCFYCLTKIQAVIISNEPDVISARGATVPQSDFMRPCEGNEECSPF